MCSRTLDPGHHPRVAVIGDDVETTVAALRAGTGRGIWLFGGGRLFATLLAAELVDDIELAVMPVLLGAGVPLLAPGAPRSRLLLRRSNASPAGIVNLHYELARTSRER